MKANYSLKQVMANATHKLYTRKVQKGLGANSKLTFQGDKVEDKAKFGLK